MARWMVFAALACGANAANREEHRAARHRLFASPSGTADAAFMRRQAARHAPDHSPVSELVDSSILSIHSDAATGTGVKAQYPFYHTSDELRSETMRLVKSCKAGASIKTLSQAGVDIDVVTIEAKTTKPTNRVFILFGEHSRELISPESGLHFLKALCGEVQLNSQETSVAQVLGDNTFQLVLNGNPRSRRKVELGSYCVRENPSGVDLNRNWDEKWQATSATNSETNPGPRPFSEPETQIFKQLVTDFQPTLFLTVHSGTRGMYMPWAYDMQHLANRNQLAMMEILQKLDAKHCKCPFGAAGKEVGYSCPGTCLDWVYDQLKTPFSFAFEIYVDPPQDEDLTHRWNDKISKGGSSLLQAGEHLGHNHFRHVFEHHSSDFVQTAQRRDDINDEFCFKDFNPDTKERYDENVQNWATVYLEMSHLVHQKLMLNSTVPVVGA